MCGGKKIGTCGEKGTFHIASGFGGKKPVTCGKKRGVICVEKGCISYDFLWREKASYVRWKIALINCIRTGKCQVAEGQF